jgi:hypothetical protein
MRAPLAHLVAAQNALDQVDSASVDPSETLLVAHMAARIYDEALAQLNPPCCAGTYWREDAAFKEAARLLVEARGRKRGRPMDYSAKRCTNTVTPRMGPKDKRSGQTFRICATCRETLRRDESDDLVVVV